MDYQRTFVSMLAPNEKPSPNSGRFGNVFFNHFTVCAAQNSCKPGPLDKNEQGKNLNDCSRNLPVADPT